MANMFDTPIAATPIQEFVPINNNVLERALQRKQDNYDKAQAQMEVLENSLLDLNALPRDKEENLAIQNEFQKELINIAEASGGDYTTVMPRLNSLKNKIKREVTSGTLNAHNKAYSAGMANVAEAEKRYVEGKAGLAGLNQAKQAVAQHKTVLDEGGMFNSYQGYSPSTIANLDEFLDKGLKNVHEDYTSDGDKYMSKAKLTEKAMAMVYKNPELIKSFQETYANSPTKEQESFNEFVSNSIQGSVKALMYQDNTKRDANAKAAAAAKGLEYSKKTGSPYILRGMSVPQTLATGNSSMVGGSASNLKGMMSYLGFDTEREFRTWENSEKGKQAKVRVQRWKKDAYPTNYVDKVAWWDEARGRERTSDISVNSITEQQRMMFDDNGLPLNPTAAIYDAEGELVEGGAIEIAGEGAMVTGVIDGTNQYYPPGTLVVRGADEAVYFMETPSSAAVTANPYQEWQINGARRSNMGDVTVDLVGGITSADGKVAVPPGTYNASVNPSDNSIVISDTTGKPVAKQVRSKNGGYIYYPAK